MLKKLLKSSTLALILLSLASSCTMVCHKCCDHDYKHSWKSKKEYKNNKTCSKHNRDYKKYSDKNEEVNSNQEEEKTE